MSLKSVLRYVLYMIYCRQVYILIWRARSSLLLLVSVASALVIEAPEVWVSGATVTETWETTSPDDPVYFSLELRSTDASYAIADNLLTARGSVTLTLPTVYYG